MADTRQSLGAVVFLCALGACSPQPARSAPEAADLVKASAGPVKDVVYTAMLDAEKAGRHLVVYVGASWCEPCEVFTGALEAGALPRSLGSLRFLKFDNDADDGRLIEANYGGQMIPRFVNPRADGTGSSTRFEGSVKGPEAIGNIVPRLEELIREQK